MRPTEQLKAEHEDVKLTLRILGKILKGSPNINPQHFASILEYLKMFVDKCHHGKEEDLLFPAMEEAGIPREGGPIGVMLAEHVEGRGYIKGMSEGFDEFNKNGKDLSKIIDNGKKYIDLLEPHIEKENNILYMMEDQVLSRDVQKNWKSGLKNLR